MICHFIFTCLIGHSLGKGKLILGQVKQEGCLFKLCVGFLMRNSGISPFRILMQQQSPYQTRYVMHNAFKNLPALEDL